MNNGITWDEQKIRQYFDDCEKRYEHYYTGITELEKALRSFADDDEHTGEEAESARYFVTDVMIPMLDQMARVIRLLQTKQDELLYEFDSLVDSSDSTIDCEEKLTSVIKDFSGYLTSFDSISESIVNAAKALNSTCTLGGLFSYTNPIPTSTINAFEKLTDESGVSGLVPVHKKAFLSFDDAHKNDVSDGSEFGRLMEMIMGNIRRIKNAAAGADLTTVISDYKHQIELQKQILKPNDVLNEEELKEFEAYVEQLGKYLRGEATRCSVFGSDPVNMTEGNYVGHWEDIVLPGTPSFGFTRYYNALSDRESVLGRGWSHSFHKKITVEEKEDNTEKILVLTEDGSEHLYFSNEKGDISSEVHGEEGKLKKAGSGWIIKFSDGTKEKYDERGWLKNIELIAGGKITIERDQEHPERIRLVKALNGNQLTFSYDEDGYLTGIHDHAGRSVSYRYKEKNIEGSKEKLLSEIDTIMDSVVHIMYDEGGRICAIGKDGDKVILKNEYGIDGRIIRQFYADENHVSFKYNDAENETIYTEQNGNVIRYFKDDRRRHIATVYGNGREYFEYDDSNNLISRTNRVGSVTRYSYDSNGHIKKITDPLGGEVYISYNSDGRIAAVKRADGSEWRYWYNSRGNIIKVENPEKYITRYEYTPIGECSKIIYADGTDVEFKYIKGCVTQIKYEDDSVCSFEYNRLNQCSAKIDSEGNKTTFDYDNAGNLVSVTDPLGNTTRYSYDARRKLTRVEYPDNTSIINEYDAMGKICGITDENGNHTVIKYNKMLKEAERILPNGGHIKKEYDEYMNLIRETDAVGNEITYTYDPLGNLLSKMCGEQVICSYSYDALNRKISETDGKGRKTCYEYDRVGNLTLVRDAAGNRTIYEYDSIGHVVSKTDANGNRTCMSYDSRGRISSKVDAEGHETEYKYDKKGNLVEILFCGKMQETRSYNSNRLITVRKFADGYTIKYSYDAASHVTGINRGDGSSVLLKYDSRGRIVEKNDNGRITQYAYFADGKLKAVTDAAGHITEYGRDKNGNISMISTPDDIRHITKYEYDLAGRLTASVNALGARNRYKYDSLGKLISKIDREDMSTEFCYDPSGRLTDICYSDGNKVHFSFDEAGHISEFSDSTGKTDIICDAIGNIIKITDPKGQTVSFEYDGINKRKSITYPDGKRVEYVYDGLGRLAKLLNGEKSVMYSYDEYDRLIKKTLPSNASTTYGYYKGGNLQSLTSYNGEDMLYHSELLYNANGERNEIRRFSKDFPENTGVFGYEYDELGHLRNVKKDGKTLRRYDYDVFGNRIQKDEQGHIIHYMYNELDQLTTSSEISVGGEKIEKYYKSDSRGNLTEIIEDDNVQKYEYDAAGMMKRAAMPSGTACDYVYNGIGFKVSETRNYGDETGAKVVNEYFCDLTRDSGNLIQCTRDGKKESFLWDDNIISVNHDNDDYYYMQDEIGSPTYLTGIDGEVMAEYSFDEFGRDILNKHRTDNDRLIQPFTFTGYQSDDITGFRFAQARFYDPETGRFLSEDQLRGTSIEPESQNHYLYCRNMPLDHIDPNGKWTFTIKIGINATLFLGISGDIDLSFDGHGNVAVQYSEAIPFHDNEMAVGIADAGIALQFQGTCLDSVEDLEGVSSTVGASGGYLGYFGIDGMSTSPMNDLNDKDFEGIQIGVGLGIGMDIHLVQGNTHTLFYLHKAEETACEG